MMSCHLHDWVTKNSGFHLVHPLLLHFLLTLMKTAVMLCPVLWRGTHSKHRAKSPVNRHLGIGAPSPTACEGLNPAHNHMSLGVDASWLETPPLADTLITALWETPKQRSQLSHIGLLTLRNQEIINVCSFKPLGLGGNLIHRNKPLIRQAHE